MKGRLIIKIKELSKYQKVKEKNALKFYYLITSLGRETEKENFRKDKATSLEVTKQRNFILIDV